MMGTYEQIRAAQVPTDGECRGDEGVPHCRLPSRYYEPALCCLRKAIARQMNEYGK